MTQRSLHSCCLAGNQQHLSSTTGSIILATSQAGTRGQQEEINTHHPKNREFKAIVLKQDTLELPEEYNLGLSLDLHCLSLSADQKVCYCPILSHQHTLYVCMFVYCMCVHLLRCGKRNQKSLLLPLTAIVCDKKSNGSILNHNNYSAQMCVFYFL